MTRRPSRRKSSQPGVGRRPPRDARPTSTEPVWQQAAQRIEADVVAGRYAAGGRLPHEAALAGSLGISRHALRRAIASLVARGLLRSIAKIGTFVAPRRIPFPVGAATRIADAIAQAGLAPGLRMISQRRCAPPAEVAQRLRVARRTEVIEIVHVVTGNAVPLALVTNWAPADRFGRLGQLTEALGSLRAAMAQMGVPPLSHMSARITSRLAGASERELLDLAAGAIVTSMDGACADATGEPTHAFVFCFNADRFELVLDL